MNKNKELFDPPVKSYGKSKALEYMLGALLHILLS